jgi:antitoxin (DNA-binding transcriptional repressor) of toxin-antitoxin stability system
MVEAMDKRISIAQAKDHFSSLIESAERGMTITVTRRGKPVARRRKVAWSPAVLDTRGFRFDREDANRR